MNASLPKRKINIVGAGAYGVFLAFQIDKLAKDSNVNIEINLHERGPSIIPGWRSVTISDYRVNNGFHGLEMPRALDSYQMLQELIGEDFFTRFKNRKLVCIEGSLLNFRSPISSLPEWCARDFSPLTPILNKSSIPLAFSSVPPTFFDSSVGRSFKNSSSRYGDDFEKSWGQFYPWFFPIEFPSDCRDEGWVFRDNLDQHNNQAYYLSPKSFLFEDMIEPIYASLVDRGVNIHLNSLFSLGCDSSSSITDGSMNIWAASSAVLLKSFSESAASSLYQSKRSLILILFEVPDSFRSSISVLDAENQLPSEIIVSSSDVPGVSRISFPNKPINKSYHASSTKVLVEFYSKKPRLSENDANSIASFLEFILSAPVSLLGHSLGRTMFNPTPNEIVLAADQLSEHLESSPWIVPAYYWWPINIAKCGSLAIESASSILNSL